MKKFTNLEIAMDNLKDIILCHLESYLQGDTDALDFNVSINDIKLQNATDETLDVLYSEACVYTDDCILGVEIENDMLELTFSESILNRRLNGGF